MTATHSTLSMYVIYERPPDAPKHYVVRRWEIVPGEPIPREATRHTTLADARAAVPRGRVMMSRAPDDPPAVIEVWI